MLATELAAVENEGQGTLMVDRLAHLRAPAVGRSTLRANLVQVAAVLGALLAAPMRFAADWEARQAASRVAAQ